MEFLVDCPLLLVEGPPRVGRTSLAAQISRAALGRASVVDGRANGALRLDPELGLAELLGSPRSGRVLVVDNADADPAILEAAFALSAQAVSTRLVLIGAHFPAAGARPQAASGQRPPRLELGPLSLAEAGAASRSRHWLRGGYPEAFLASNDAEAFAWLSDYLERLAESRLLACLPWAPGRARSLLAMLAEGQGRALNESELARDLGVSRPSVARSLGALEEAGILRALPSLPGPAGKRARLSPVRYLRDSGLFHALSGLASAEALLESPCLARSWESYAIEQILRALPRGVEAARYRSQDGAGLELVLSRGGRPLAGAAIRWARPGGAVPKGARIAAADLGTPRNYLVLPEAEGKELGGSFVALSVGKFIEEASGI
jgi:DNA-binding transcriptional ArsR family regulator